MRSTTTRPANDSPGALDDLQFLGSRIVERRRVRGWTQRELARRADMEAGRLSRIERGISLPRLEELTRLLLAFGGSADDLLFGGPAADGRLDPLDHEIGRLASSSEIAVLRRFFRLLVFGDPHNAEKPTGGEPLLPAQGGHA